MSRRLRQQTHRSTEQQRKNHQNTNRIESIPLVYIHSSSSVLVSRAGFSMCSSTSELVHGDYRDDEETEDNHSNEYVDEFVDARAAVEGDVGVCCFFLGLWCAEVFLSSNSQHRVTGFCHKRVNAYLEWQGLGSEDFL